MAAPDRESAFDLPVNITIGGGDPDSRRGDIGLTWTHTLGCVRRYKLELTNSEGQKGEMIIDAPEFGEDVEIDLHMLPGILTLVNCRVYTLNISPKVHHAEDGVWFQGQEKKLKYTLEDGRAPNAAEVQSFVPDWNKATLAFDQPLTCNDLELRLYTYRGLEHNLGEEGKEVSRQVLPYSEESHEIEDLKPCIQYKYELWDAEEQILLEEKSFRTNGNPEAIEKLTQSEVGIKLQGASAQIEWVDRCAQGYQLELCKIPESCETFKILDMSGSEGTHPMKKLDLSLIHI